MKPKLPPRKGYVEVILNGERAYRNTQTGEIVRPGVPAAESNKGGGADIALLRAEIAELRSENAELSAAIERGLSL